MCVCVSVYVYVLGGEESRKGQASEGLELGLTFFTKSRDPEWDLRLAADTRPEQAHAHPSRAAARAACSCVRNTAGPTCPAKPVQWLSHSRRQTTAL